MLERVDATPRDAPVVFPTRGCIILRPRPTDGRGRGDRWSEFRRARRCRELRWLGRSAIRSTLGNGPALRQSSEVTCRVDDQNLRRDFYDLGTDAPPGSRLAYASAELALAI